MTAEVQMRYFNGAGPFFRAASRGGGVAVQASSATMAFLATATVS
jgi:hypothetical protein